MREIKFRAWDLEDKVWWGSLPLDGFTGQVMGSNAKVALMQYTGLKDFDGNEIYEGDILYYGGPTSARLHRRIIQWDSLRARFNITQIMARRCLIKGNIYDNPDLAT